VKQHTKKAWYIRKPEASFPKGEQKMINISNMPTSADSGAHVPRNVHTCGNGEVMWAPLSSNQRDGSVRKYEKVFKRTISHFRA
jgi:hypothetical protein